MVKVYLEALGCRLNTAEIEALAGEFSGAGCEIVRDPHEADVIVLNTCAVTAQATRKSRHRVHALHRVNPSARLAITGCWATADPAHVQALEGVRWALPNASKSELVWHTTGVRTSPAPWSPARWGHTRAFLKVQDGCDHHCTYCVTRLLRGPAHSRPLAEIIAAAHERVSNGAQEVVLTGVSLGSYGSDLSPSVHLSELVKAILRETAVPRLRLSSIEPWDVDEALIDLWNDPRLCRQLHLPLQSGSDAVLRRMGRPITVDAYVQVVKRARRVSPEIAITTDLITGFPGEREEDFARTLALVEDLAFARLHVFPYSERAGTAAVRLPGRVPVEVRKARARMLREKGERLATAYRRHFLGQTLSVLWERQNGRGEWVGLSDNYLEIRARSEALLHNRIANTLLVQSEQGFLRGEVVLG